MISNKLSATILFACSVGLLAQSAVANTSPEQVIISSGKQQAQLQTNIGVFEDNVEIIHGSRKITADRLEVHRREELGDNKQLLVATGDPAIFQEQQADGSILKASAKEVRYDVANKLLTIKGNAEISQAGQKISAQEIRYDMDKQLISAQRSDQEGKRVRTVLLPVDDKKETNEEQP
ncbi:lipopolysaccharide transport periplasmic protein LptA [Pseudoalteromonas luteoviolacea]|uniref:lipopolysaccharide transport periplasmic protein LptA n=1 Tax=Pseudoalteromonas luteoviolacea TaxID=43657 RepID=UPI000AF47839|nr:lipopolysaccharide transport periplasmic protein LptA [Pseudoalteromonas luteoviolacea]MBQ4812123.1 lipopolysaccharide transport periplasmic protein LptA [Pseudoalteromonas luteoviolacea]